MNSDFDPMRLCQLQIQADTDELVERKILEQKKNGKKTEKRGNFLIADGQNVSVKEHLHVARRLRISADYSESGGNHSGEEYSDNGIRGKPAPLFDRHDTESDDHRQKRHGEVRTDGENQSECHSGKRGVSDCIGEERHPEIHNLSPCHCRHRCDKNQPQHGFLHKAHLHAFQRDGFSDEFT